jgi:thiol-disulfide isomerase/thioredoxin
MYIRQQLLAIVFCLAALSTQAQSIGVAKITDLDQILASKNDTTYVLNFWATWCVPCVKEFPAFQMLARDHKGEKMKVVMVSLDFKKDMMRSLVPYIQRHPINASVLLLDEPDYNSWINKIDSSWGGEIPVTLMLNGSKNKRRFYAHDFTPQNLEDTYLNFTGQ